MKKHKLKTSCLDLPKVKQVAKEEELEDTFGINDRAEETALGTSIEAKESEREVEYSDDFVFD